MKIIKVYASKRFDLKPDSSPVVPTDFEVTIPPHHYGTFYIRESLGSQGVDSPNSVFHAGWHGKPRITLTHGGGQDVIFNEGMEIGELHIRYTPPSPYFGDQMEIDYPFMIHYKDDNTIEVTTKHGHIYKVEKIIIPENAVNDKLINNCHFVHSHQEFTGKSMMVQYTLKGYGDREHMSRCNSLIPFTQDRMLSHYEKNFGLAAELKDRAALGELLNETASNKNFDPQISFEVPSSYNVVLTPTGYAFRKGDKTVMVTANLYCEDGPSTLLSLTPNVEYKLENLAYGYQNRKFKVSEVYFKAKDLPGIAGSVTNNFFRDGAQNTDQITVARVLDGNDHYYAIQIGSSGDWVRLNEYNRIFIDGVGLHQQEIEFRKMTLNSTRTYAPSQASLRYQAVLPISTQRISDCSKILKLVAKSHEKMPILSGTGHEKAGNDKMAIESILFQGKPIYFVSNGALDVDHENEILLNRLRKDAEIYCSNSHRIAAVIRHAILHTNVRDEILENTDVLRILYKAAIKVLIGHTKTNAEKPLAPSLAIQLAEMLGKRLRQMSLYNKGWDYDNLVTFLSQRGIGWKNPELIFDHIDLSSLTPNPLIE